MSELDKVLVWPLSIRPVNKLSNAPKTGVTVAKYRTGAEIRRTYQDAPLASFKAVFFASPLHESYEDDMVWFRAIEDGIGSFLFMNPHQDFWLNDVIGIGDGVRTTWVLPYLNWLGTPIIHSGNELISDLTIFNDGPNLLNFNSSIANWDSGDMEAEVGTVAGKSRSYNGTGRCYNRGNVSVVVGNIMFPGNTSVSASVSIADGDSINGIADVRGDPAVSCHVILSLDSGLVNGSAVSISESEWEEAIATTIASGSRTLDEVSVFSASSSDRTHYIGALGITRGDLMTWYPGSVRMPVVVFDSPPALGAVISSKVEKANRMLKVTARSVSHAIDPDGNRFITVTLDEAP